MWKLASFCVHWLLCPYVSPLHHKISQLAMYLQKPHACIQRVSSFQCPPRRQFASWRCYSRLFRHRLAQRSDRHMCCSLCLFMCFCPDNWCCRSFHGSTAQSLKLITIRCQCCAYVWWCWCAWNYHQPNLVIPMIELIWCSAVVEIIVLFGAACGAQLPR